MSQWRPSGEVLRKHSTVNKTEVISCCYAYVCLLSLVISRTQIEKLDTFNSSQLRVMHNLKDAINHNDRIGIIFWHAALQITYHLDL